MDLKTTTRPNRHTTQFQTARSLLEAARLERPIDVLEVGPGLAVKFLGRLTDERNPGWDLVKRIESGIRRIPMPDVCYENYETRELLEALRGFPIRLTILDVNARVLRIVKGMHSDVPIETVVADLGVRGSAALADHYGRFDLVVAQAVLGRVRRTVRDIARDNLVSLARPGGLLLVDGDLAAVGCEPVDGFAGFSRRIG
jgi:hypothetical protein